MKVQATHGLAAGDLRQLDGLRPKRSATENPALPLVPATPRELRWAFAIVIVSVLVLAVVIPFAGVPLLKVTAFIPSYESAMAFCDLMTAVLLFGGVTRRRSLAFLALASGYLFNATIIVVHLLTFPGAFSDAGLLGANPKPPPGCMSSGTAASRYLSAVMPCCRSATANLRTPQKRGVGGQFSAIGVVAVVAALTLLATVGHGVLPTIIQAGNYSLMISTGASPTILALSALALFALLRRRERTVLNVWLMVVISIWLFDIILSAVVSSSRYDLGWYAGRSYGLVAACCLLIILLFEMNRLYDRLNAALATAQTLELDLTFRAENDSLTGLPNRGLFDDRLTMAMARCRRSNNLMALLYVESIISRRSMTIWAMPPAMSCSVRLRNACRSACAHRTRWRASGATNSL